MSLRVRLMGRAAARIDAEPQRAHLRRPAGAARSRAARSGDGLQPLRDLDQIRAFLASAGTDGALRHAVDAALSRRHLPVASRCSGRSPPCRRGAARRADAAAPRPGVPRPSARAAQCAAQRWALRGGGAAQCRGRAAPWGFKRAPGHRWSALNDRHLDAQCAPRAPSQRRRRRDQGGAPGAAVGHARARRLSGDQRRRRPRAR